MTPIENISGSSIQNSLLVLFIVLATTVAFYVSFVDTSAELLYEQNSIDPLVFRAAGNLLSEGQSPYSQENQMQNIASDRLDGEQPPFAIPFSYPPNSLPLFHLRSLAGPELNSAVHMAVSVLFSLLCLTLLCFKYLDHGATRLIMVFTAAFWTPALLDMRLAQTGHLVAMLAFLFLLLYDNKPILAGIVLGLLAFKPQYAIPLGLVALTRQSWPLLGSAASTFMASCLLSALLYGWGMWGEFWHSATAVNTTLYYMESWLGVASLAFPDHVESISKWAIAVYGLGMLLLSALLFMLGKKSNLLGAAALAIALAIIISPNTHLYDFGLIFIPALYLTREFGTRIWFAVIVFLVFLIPNAFFTLSTVTVMSILQLCFLVACFLLVLWKNIKYSRSAGNGGLPVVSG